MTIISSLCFCLTSLFPVIEADLSDSGTVDNVLELLVMAGGRSLPEVTAYRHFWINLGFWETAHLPLP